MINFREKDGGFTTFGMAIALVVSVALVLASLQVYRINQVTSKIQNVADIAALSAENEVAEFVVIARACDAIVLSFSLTGITCVMVGTVLLCIPGASGVADTFITAGDKIMKVRDQFSKSAAKGLNTFQKALPYLAAVSAYCVANANNDAEGETRYSALAILCPSVGEEIGVDSMIDKAQEIFDQIENGSGDVEEEVNRTDEIEAEAQRIKEKAFASDCGDYPEYCLYERVSALTSLSGRDNPYYSSVDAWSFSVPLARAQAYYRARLKQESGFTYTDSREQAKSILRQKYYEYGVELMESGYVQETADTFHAYFPLMPKNQGDIEDTELYIRRMFPVTEDEAGVRYMHAWTGCPACDAVVDYGSIKEFDEGDYGVCGVCGFTVDSLSKVGAASSVIDNGFELHYRRIAELAKEYEEVMNSAGEISGEVRESVLSWTDALGELFAAMSKIRIEVSPPGGTGVIVIVVDTGQPVLTGGLRGNLVISQGDLGTRVAVSGATIIEEGDQEGYTIITSMARLMGGRTAGATSSAGDVFLRIWSNMLEAYSRGQSAVSKATENALNGFSWIGGGALGTWAAGVLEDALKGMGLQPADIDMVKPVLINTSYVAEAQAGAGSGSGSSSSGGSGSGDWTGGFSAKYVALKDAAQALGQTTGDLQDVLTNIELAAIQEASKVTGRVEILTTELRNNEINLPAFHVTITLTKTNRENLPNIFESILQMLLVSESRERMDKVWR